MSAVARALALTPAHEMSAAEWRRAYFALAEIALRQQAETRRQVEALPVHSWSGYEWEWDCSEDYHDGERCPHPEEHNDVITISRTRLLALLPTQASDSPEKP